MPSGTMLSRLQRKFDPGTGINQGDLITKVKVLTEGKHVHFDASKNNPLNPRIRKVPGTLNELTSIKRFPFGIYFA